MTDIWDAFDSVESSMQEISPCDDKSKHIKVKKKKIMIKKSPPSSNICEYCKSSSLLYEDTVVCSNCGAVNNIALDYSLETRYYGTDDNKNSGDPSRCGGPSNPLLPNLSMGTLINGHGNEIFRKLHKWNSVTYKERSLIKVFNKITTTGSEGIIPTCILDKASVMYKMLSEDSIKRGSSRESLIAACIWNALKAKDSARSTKEIAKLFKISIKKMTLGCKEFNEKMYNKNKNFVNNIKPTKSADYINRYCMLLKLDRKYIKEVEHIVNIAHLIGILIQNTPQSIAIGCIFIVSEKHNLGFTKKILHSSCDISEVTISKTYKELIKYSKYIFMD